MKAEALVKRILTNSDLFLFLPPEGKGRLLHSLCRSYWLSFEEKQEEAIIAILEKIQTWNEYKEIMEHVTEDGSRIKPKQASGDDDAFNAGEDKIMFFLDGKESNEFFYNRVRLFMKRNEELKKSPIQKNTKAIRDNGVIA